MITRRHSKMRLCDIIMPGEVAERIRDPRVIALAESLPLTGGQPLEAITVDERTKELVSGKDRAAACIIAGLKTVDVLLVTGTEREMKALMLVENAHRRHDTSFRDASLSELEIMRQEDLNFPSVS